MKVAIASALLLCTGCATIPDKQFDLMRGLAADAATRLADGAVGQYQVSGQGLNPGIVLEAAVVYRASARYDGIAGQFGVAASGTLGREVPVGEILSIINDSSRSESEKSAAVADLLKRWASK